jgi:hypothetical protein
MILTIDEEWININRIFASYARMSVTLRISRKKMHDDGVYD